LATQGDFKSPLTATQPFDFWRLSCHNGLIGQTTAAHRKEIQMSNMKNQMISRQDWFENQLGKCSTSQLFSAVNRAKKHGFANVANYIKCYSDVRYSASKGNSEESLKRFNDSLVVLDAAFEEANNTSKFLSKQGNVVIDAQVMDIVLKVVE
jgi:hypothetical protein